MEALKIISFYFVHYYYYYYQQHHPLVLVVANPLQCHLLLCGNIRSSGCATVCGGGLFRTRIFPLTDSIIQTFRCWRWGFPPPTPPRQFTAIPRYKLAKRQWTHPYCCWLKWWVVGWVGLFAAYERFSPANRHGRRCGATETRCQRVLRNGLLYIVLIWRSRCAALPDAGQGRPTKNRNAMEGKKREIFAPWANYLSTFMISVKTRLCLSSTPKWIN